jgi:outer membrane protein OmpA-like peptidoglycan-associated protein
MIPVDGQNLVVNPSFEDLEKCPDNLQQFDKYVKAWSTPTSGSTGLFVQCTSFSDIKAGDNYQGSQVAKAGSNYAGCYFYGIENYREYIQGSLSDSLIIGSKYKVSIWVSLADKSDMAISDISIAFIDKTFDDWTSQNIVLNKASYLSVNKQLIRFTDEIINNKEDWTLLEQEFTASEKATNFIIGNFNVNRETKKKNQKFFTKVRKAYYYIDDVSVMNVDALKKQISFEIKDKDKSVYETGKRYTFENLQFDFDKSEIRKTSFEELSGLVNFMMSRPKMNILIEGHTDEKGSESYNLELALRRVESVKYFFTLRGISPERIETVSHGEAIPKLIGNTDHMDQQNRRVEFTLLDK